MRKAFKIFIGVVIALILLIYAGQYFMIKETKKHSPKIEENYAFGTTEINLVYCSPFKKGRVIFGNLVPYGHVWRTGANEPTTITTNVDLKINGKILPAGEYTLWTVPESDHWQVIFNSKINDWGVQFGGKASRDPKFDVLEVAETVKNLDSSVESFKIWVDTPLEKDTYYLHFSWDKIQVDLTMNKQ
ncbi:DUF2911 domain-containing protein [Flammeovirga kamogawensis]|uniref:DUF2911 domain-containing protein n=1 Tax=Flammeovirga kamogawensis TaxID=373891 RepID=A0ABX8H1S5_9BACT|nr:DUF2911 domain-containing protein [Flammeovirga kamogawensis]MBB6459544.1 hypothetical protein [Flammeovirga kamogawensis]QWG09095.1 DUF2911 domain-containing protein [Flammeovirga kamogawensis]TRX67383.1 DUF2911 domain-containing protein [Flammeovirga kamogawensis]